MGGVFLPFDVRRSVVQVREVFDVLVFLGILGVDKHVPANYMVPLVLAYQESAVRLGCILPVIAIYK